MNRAETQRPSDVEGELDFSDAELTEMGVEITGRSERPKRKSRPMLRVPADEVTRPSASITAPLAVISLADSLVDHAFTNGGAADGLVPSLLTLALDEEAPAADEPELLDADPDADDVEVEDVAAGDSPFVEAKPRPFVPPTPAAAALVRAVTTPAHPEPEPEPDIPVQVLSAVDPVVGEDAVFSSAPPPSAEGPAVTVGSDTAAPAPPLSPNARALASAIGGAAKPADAEEEIDDAELEEDDDKDARSRSLTPPMPPPAPISAGPPPAPARPPEAPRAEAKAEPPAPPPAAAKQPPELRGRKKKRTKQWFEELFDDDYLRTLPSLTARQTEREAEFVEAALGVPAGGAILDVGCGYGRHATELTRRGYKVTGLDASLPLLIRGADNARQNEVNINFVHGDMREMSFKEEFDGAYCMFTSFGYFDDDTNRKVAANLAAALKPGGKLLVDIVNRDYLVGDLPTRVWWQGDGCVVLEEVDFNYFSSRVQVQRSCIFEDGRQVEHEISIRAYSLHEIGKVLHHSGFRVTEVSGGLALKGVFFGAHSRQMLVVAEKKLP